MSQRVFDVKNEKDVKDLFNLFPDDVVKISKSQNEQSPLDAIFLRFSDGFVNFLRAIKINWHDERGITRPFDKSKWIGFLCWFWDRNGYKGQRIGFLESIDKNSLYSYHQFNGYWWENCCPVKRDEIKFVEDAK